MHSGKVKDSLQSLGILRCSLRFTIWPYGLSLFFEDFIKGSYVDDIILYGCHKNFTKVKTELEVRSLITLERFKNNYLIANSGKSNILLVLALVLVSDI